MVEAHSHPSVDRPPPSSPATVRNIVADAASDVVAAHGAFPSGEVRYVEAPTSCPPGDACQPLSRVVDVGVAVGHLHWAATTPPAACDPAAAPVDLRVLSSLVAAHVARDLLDVRLAQREHDVADLRTALETNRAIGVAIGIIMALERCTAEAAFGLLRAASQHQNRKLRDIADDVQYTGALPEVARAAS